MGFVRIVALIVVTVQVSLVSPTVMVALLDVLRLEEEVSLTLRDCPEVMFPLVTQVPEPLISIWGLPLPETETATDPEIPVIVLDSEVTSVLNS